MLSGERLFVGGGGEVAAGAAVPVFMTRRRSREIAALVLPPERARAALERVIVEVVRVLRVRRDVSISRGGPPPRRLLSPFLGTPPSPPPVPEELELVQKLVLERVRLGRLGSLARGLGVPPASDAKTHDHRTEVALERRLGGDEDGNLREPSRVPGGVHCGGTVGRTTTRRGATARTTTIAADVYIVAQVGLPHDAHVVVEAEDVAAGGDGDDYSCARHSCARRRSRPPAAAPAGGVVPAAGLIAAGFASQQIPRA